MRQFQHRSPPETAQREVNAVGCVALVGAGPGDPDLLTLRAARLIADADVILYDALAGREILQLASPGAVLVPVGKRCGRHFVTQAEINRLIVAHAKNGSRVVRLKGGDPFVFGRGGEELDAARAAGIPVEIVPGVTAACAAAASLAMPLTQRGVSRTLHLMSGHPMVPADGKPEPEEDWTVLTREGATLVLYMGSTRLEQIAQRMVAAGVSPSLPVVAVENASAPGERHCGGTVGTIASTVAEAGFRGPTLLVFGEVARPFIASLAFSSASDRASCAHDAGAPVSAWQGVAGAWRSDGWSSFRVGSMAEGASPSASLMS